MGRGNVCTHNECEGLYYLDRDFIDVYCKVTRCGCGHVNGMDRDEEPMTARELQEADTKYDFDGTNTGWAFDRCETDVNWDDMIWHMKDGIQKRFKSFSETDRWRGDRHIVLESSLFEIAVVDNEWSAAWCLLERDDVDDTGPYRTLMRRHYETYLEAIKLILIDEWGEAIGYGGAWTHGKKYTKEDVA